MKRRRLAAAAIEAERRAEEEKSWQPISLLFKSAVRELLLGFLGVEKVCNEELLPSLIFFGFVNCLIRNENGGELDYLSDKEVWYFLGCLLLSLIHF